MAESTRDIKRRIRSVKSTRKITNAMEMVAASKLRKAQQGVESARPYSEKIQEVLRRLVSGAGGYEHPLLLTQEEGKIGYVIITGDRGLAGGYNINIMRLAQDSYETEEEDVGLITLGKKGREYFRYRGYELFKYYLNIGDLPSFTQAKELAKELKGYYEDGTFKEVHLFFNKFISPIQQNPTKLQLLPIETGNGEGEESQKEYIFEPSPGDVLNELLPKYVEIQVYQALLEAKASEHGARMTAMSSATDNADEMIDSLTLSYNRARQAAITTELTEIVGGAEAQK